jgi:hypothetical protein
VEPTQARRAIELACLLDRRIGIDMNPGTDVGIAHPDSRQAISHQASEVISPAAILAAHPRRSEDYARPGPCGEGQPLF